MTKKYDAKVCIFIALILFIGCKKDDQKFDLSKNFASLETRYEKFQTYPLDSLGFPRSIDLNDKIIKKVSSKDWTSGFFAGNLWQLYSLSLDEEFKAKASAWTAFIEREKFNNKTHDMGFKILCSYGKGQNREQNETYKNVIVHSAQTLSTRFNENVQAIRSWDFNKDKWEFPVIIDNMMNLELLFEATKISGDSLYHHIAVKHANTTLKHHVRKDNSTYHVVVFDTINGETKQKITHQGFNNESSWARGQAWCIYGYTMAYRYTKNKDYLNQAIATGEFFLTHKNLPKDGIPYWDFDDPNIPKASRDVSAAAIICSAFLELHEYTQNQIFLEYSKKIIKTLGSEKYSLKSDVNAPFILNHSTGNWPKDDEIDVPIVYADYYYLEALLRILKYYPDAI